MLYLDGVPWAVDEPRGEIALSSFALFSHLFAAGELQAAGCCMEEEARLYLGGRERGAVDLNILYQITLAKSG